MKLDNDVLGVLRQATFTTDSVKLNGQLERKIYLKVNKALEAAAGQWNRKRAAHIFKQDPHELFNLETGEVLSGNVNAAGIAHAVANGNGAAIVPDLFPTPPELARRMVQMADIKPGHRILEPSAGTGNILSAIKAADWEKPVDATGEVLAIEINQALASTLHARFGVKVICGNFLGCPLKQEYDRILMNPPFSKWQDIKHIQYALKLLKPGGRLVAICAGGSRQKDELWPLVERCGGIWEPLPPDTFKDAGTSVNAVLMVIDVDAEDHELEPPVIGFKVEFPMTGGSLELTNKFSLTPLPGRAVTHSHQLRLF